MKIKQHSHFDKCQSSIRAIFGRRIKIPFRLCLTIVIANLFMIVPYKSNCQQSQWYIGNELIINHTIIGSPVINSFSTASWLTNMGLNTNNSIVDISGDVIAVFDNGVIYDVGGNQQLPLYRNVYDAINGLTETVIVPVPDECLRYYIISADRTSGSAMGDPEVYYATLDVTDPASFQIVSTTTAMSNVVQLTNISNVSVHEGGLHIAVSKLNSSTNERKLFVQVVSGELYTYRITHTGIVFENMINLNPVFMNAGFFNVMNSSAIYRSEMELHEHSNGSYSLAFPIRNAANQNSFARAIGVVNFNSNGSIIAVNALPVALVSQIGTGNAQVKGIEFSSNGNYIYTTYNVSPYLSIFDLNTTQSISLPPSFVNLQNFKNSQIELANDGNLYLTSGGNLARIENSNSPSVSVFNSNIIAYPNAISPNTGSNDDWTGFTGNGFEIFTLPDQIDGELSNPNFTTGICCKDFLSYNIISLDVNGLQTWDQGAGNPYATNTILVKTELRVKSGATLILKNLELEFSDEGKLVIENGGTVELQGSILTNTSCGSMWKGVEVWGATGILNAASQGKIILNSLNGMPSQIKFAVDGIRAWKPNDNTKSGGIVIADGAIFENCYRGIEFEKNDLGNAPGLQNVLTNCIFRTAGSLALPYPIGTLSSQGFTAREVYNIIVTGASTHFENVNNAIRLSSSYLDLNDASFTNCKIAFASDRSGNAGFISNHDISSCSFNNVHTSIYIIGGTNDRIVGNDFNLAGNPFSNNFYGVYLDGTSEFTIQDNNFTSLNYGVFVRNSGSRPSRIEYENSANIFTNCWRGIHAEGDNSGLLITCNKFILPYSCAWYIGGSLADQGSFVPQYPSNSKPSGNSFSRRNATREDICSVAGIGGGYNFTYVHSTGSAYIPRIKTLNTVHLVSTYATHPGNVYCGSDPFHYLVNDPETTKSDIENELDPARKEYMISELVAFYNSNNQLSLAIAYLEILNRTEDWMRLIPSYIFSNNLEEAQNLINDLINSNDEVNVDQGTLYSIVLNWKVNNLTPFQMDSIDESVIRMLADKTTPAGEESRRIIEMVFNDNISLTVASDTGSSRLANESTSSVVAASDYYVCRNGGENSYSISRKSGELIYATKLQLVSLEGKLIREYLLKSDYNYAFDLPCLSTEIYLLRIIENENVMAVLKLNN